MSSKNDRVRENTSRRVNQQIDNEIEERVKGYARRDQGDISQRINELEREWDVERLLEMNASTVAFAGLVLGIIHNKRWLVVPAVVLPFLFQHAVQGWCPPLPILRRLGVRTREEIDREKYALKGLRGDFQDATMMPNEAERATRYT